MDYCLTWEAPHKVISGNPDLVLLLWNKKTGGGREEKKRNEGLGAVSRTGGLTAERS